VLLIGVGDAMRGDDGIGPALVERLAPKLPQGVLALTHHGEGTGLMELFAMAPHVVVVDAMVSGAAPGTVRRLDPKAQPLPAGQFRSSSHLFSLREAIETARALDRLPERLQVVGIEGAVFTLGAGLSEPVVSALPAAEAAVLAALA